jgi:hypothetical protein
LPPPCKTSLKIETNVPFLALNLCYTVHMNTYPTLRSFPHSVPSTQHAARFPLLHCELRTAHCELRAAVPSRLPTMSLSVMSSGGTLPSSRHDRRHLVVAYPLPARSNVANVGAWRQSPVFPPATSAEVSHFTPIKKGAASPSVILCVCSVFILPLPLCYSAPLQ